MTDDARPADTDAATFLTREQMDEVLAFLENPPPPTPALIALFRGYMEGVASGRLVTDTTTPDEARAWLAQRGFA